MSSATVPLGELNRLLQGVVGPLKSDPMAHLHYALGALPVGQKPTFRAMRIVEKSQNAKTGPISATYMNQLTCPTSCPHFGNGCYAEKGLVGMHTRRIANEADEALIDMIRESKDPGDAPRVFGEAMVYCEAAAIMRHLTGERKLRVHVVGDVVTAGNANALGHAMGKHTAKKGKAAWTYTHRWREIPAVSWNGANVWASVEKEEDVQKAKLMGYASALCLPGPHKSHKIYDLNGLTIVPCPAQKMPRTVTCSTCNICANPDKMLASNRVLGFARE